MYPDIPTGARDDGFTLLEVMVALVITTLAVTGLARGASTSMVLASRATQLDQAVSRARSHLASIDQGHLAAGELSGDDGGGFRWRTTTRPVGSAARQARSGASTGSADRSRITLYAITATVTWNEGGSEQKVTLATEALGTSDGIGP